MYVTINFILKDEVMPRLERKCNKEILKDVGTFGSRFNRSILSASMQIAHDSSCHLKRDMISISFTR